MGCELHLWVALVLAISLVCASISTFTHICTRSTRLKVTWVSWVLHTTTSRRCVIGDFETTISYVTDDAMAGMTGKISDAMSGDVCFLEKRGQLQDRLPFHF